MLPTLLHDLFLTKQRGVVSCPETHEPVLGPLRPRARSTDGLRMATWDQKRQTCFNCKHVFLKSLSTTPDYCSVDCKSNALYLLAVSQTIRAVKEAAAESTKATHSETKTPSRSLLLLSPQMRSS
ncbi:hypothetical protein SPRG_17150 [Saprolegnia parasitica CBS 223.65]|uniref:Uncharacterized protein n=1 Tax=Saprolegnia parasitica (strain CBS 223.65) TaxID=695850 RepID=A0A067BSG3_SAPPC|nr:hypothetical protein SPRG_17150 [Saprolegnia parasitica CBS 223.65]KDO17206.1 hypothetical protein SPRG_17150 [Saprolegnia parasitica CBS 223.65]|eukprot:XP_012212086.1 hypothetical protein SPRG_17150 [Saprolegnia parasitica CBS 223.65]